MIGDAKVDVTKDETVLRLAMAQHGISVESSVAGESACDDPGLFGNALHLRGSVAADGTVRDIYIYTFKSNKWEGSQPAVDTCQSAYQAAVDGATVTRLDIPTYRAFGADWSTDLADAIRDALAQASTAGG